MYAGHVYISDKKVYFSILKFFGTENGYINIVHRISPFLKPIGQ